MVKLKLLELRLALGWVDCLVPDDKRMKERNSSTASGGNFNMTARVDCLAS